MYSILFQSLVLPAEGRGGRTWAIGGMANLRDKLGAAWYSSSWSSSDKFSFSNIGRLYWATRVSILKFVCLKVLEGVLLKGRGVVEMDSWRFDVVWRLMELQASSVSRRRSVPALLTKTRCT